MTGHQGFGVLLAKLSAHRALDIGALARQAGVPEPELRSVLAGVVPTSSLLRSLGPALGMHAADVFVIAGATVPDDLAPLDAGARKWVTYVLQHAVDLPSEKKSELRHLVRSLPQRKLAQPPSFPQFFDPPAGRPGAVLVRMLRYRNLDWMGMARTFHFLTGRYWSASTYGMVGAGREQLPPDLVVDFGNLLGIRVGRHGRADLGPPTPDRRPGAAHQRSGGIHATDVTTSRIPITCRESGRCQPDRHRQAPVGYCSILSLRFTARVTWPRSAAARLPMSRLTRDQMPSCGLR